MSNIYEKIGLQIRELRGSISQELLSKEIGVAPNTLSRWENGKYKPSAEDLDKLSRHFGVPISVFFPDQPQIFDEKYSALTSALGGLSKKDLEEVVRYAEFRKVRSAIGSSKKR